MASERQINANRVNAKRSTGPKTLAGKQRSSRNALKHGLAASTLWSTNDIEFPSGAMTGKRVDSIGDDLLRAQSQLSRVRRVRAELLAVVLQDQSEKLKKRLITLNRYERSAVRKRDKAGGAEPAHRTKRSQIQRQFSRVRDVF